jgi:L-alanine-DL-glutamate epimerase-like enolase superfamily enzyme
VIWINPWIISQFKYLTRDKIMKIERIETFTRGHISIVRVQTDEGAAGIGQISPYNADISATVLHRQVASHALGWDAGDIDGLVDFLFEANYKFPGTYVCRAVTGLDTALWDLRGKLEGKSVCALLGGTPRPLPVYASSMRRDITPEKEAERLVDLRQTSGFQAFKVKIGKVCGHDQDEWPGRTEALIATLRKELGEDAVILADANSCYSASKAIEIGHMLQDYQIVHFEEPCPYWEIESTAEVARALAMPVAGGEQDFDLCQWRRIINMHAVDIVQPDVCYIGGLTRALRVASMAEQAGLLCVPHSANESMVLTFSLHMMGAIPNAGPHIEYSIEPPICPEGLYTPLPEVRGGKVDIPAGPGWGVEINPDWLKAAHYQASAKS